MNFEEKYNLFKLEEKKIDLLSESFSPFLSKLLLARGIDTKKEAEDFLDISWDKMLDPFLFSDMEKVVKRILDGIQSNEKIVIFSDYDADGVPGGAAFFDFFQKIKYGNFTNYIPDRNKEGFGLNFKIIEKWKEEKVDLVITIDCGIADVEESKKMKEYGIDLIITDHHKGKKDLPESVGIINHQSDDNYPEKFLCGAGTIFKVIQALITRGKERKIPSFLIIQHGWEKWLLDVVATATICDMVPLKGENRILAHYGKLVMGKSRRDGLLAILSAGGLNKNKISCQDIAFTLGPRINAAGRLEHPDFAFNTLTKRGVQGIANAKELERINRKRKTFIATVMRGVYAKLEKREIGKVVVIGDKDWPLGVVGLIASKISEKYSVPAFVWSEFDKNTVKGSVRSNGEISIHSLMEETSESFSSFGGHEMAGGFESEFSKIHFLEEELNKNYSKAKKVKKEKKKIDLKISLDDVNILNMKEMKKLSPFGMGNEVPIFLLENIEIFKIRIFGKNSEHLELTFKNSKGQWINAIKFFYLEHFGNREFKEEEKINLICAMEENNFLGNTKLQLKIEDIY